MLQHLELGRRGRRVFQRLGHFLANAHHACEGGLVRVAEVVLDASARQVLIDGRAALTAAPVALDLLKMFGRQRKCDDVVPQFGLQYRERFAACAEHPALELGQLRGE